MSSEDDDSSEGKRVEREKSVLTARGMLSMECSTKSSEERAGSSIISVTVSRMQVLFLRLYRPHFSGARFAAGALVSGRGGGAGVWEWAGHLDAKSANDRARMMDSTAFGRKE